jgi:PAS domain S-box-containing protein
VDIDQIVSRIGNYSRDAVMITWANQPGVRGTEILWVNDAFTAMTGYSAEEAIGQTPRELLQREDFEPETRDQIREALDNWRPVRALVKNYTKAGKLFWAELDITPIADETGWFHYWLAIQRDVTDRVEYENRLHQAEERFALAASLSLYGVWDWDVASGRLYWSDEFCDIVGITQDEFNGEFEEFRSRVHPEDLERVLAAVNANLEDDIPYNIEYRVRHTDGHWVEVRARGAAQRDSEGKVLRMVGSVEDISPQKAYERKLEAERDRADSANRAKSQFLANMSHEIRTPLGGVLGMAKLLENTELDSQQRGYLAAIESSGEALLSLVEDVLYISRIEAGEVAIEDEAFNLSAIVRRAGESVRGLALDKGLDHEVLIDTSLDIEVRGAPKRLLQILINLLGNAVKFTESGGVSMLAKPVAKDRYAFFVGDTGCGIPESAQARIFERFQQADNSDTRRHGGSGLGLAIAQELVTIMGGDIGFESTPGAGSKFWVELDLPAARAVASGAVARASGPLPPGLRALIVEDNETAHEVLRNLLEAEGAATLSARNGEEGQAILQSDAEIDVVLLDLQMPLMSGEELLDWIRSDCPAHADTPVVVITAKATVEAAVRAVEAGARSYITKPFIPDRLIAEIARSVSPSSETA